MDKKHTFAICAYNESPYLEECIKSVIAQKEYSEVILSTSTPNQFIKDLCKKYSIPMFVNCGKKGISGDWEYSIMQAGTPVVTIAHQDDVYFEDYSRMVIEEYSRSGHPLILFTDYYEIRNGEIIRNNRLLQIKRLMLLPLRLYYFRSSRWIRRRVLSLGSAICCPSVAYVPNNLPNSIFSDHFRTNVDWEAWERISGFEGEFIYIPRPLMAHRIHSASETSRMIEEGGRSSEDYEMYCKFWPKPIAAFLTKSYKASENSNRL